ncbi:MAG: polyprenyl synthetase family protein [Candidatus Woesearchaeota archaeon]|nr:polyprenyl synthetase family protein [Candidatus Woesearchaeota archaeon]
MKQYLDDKLLRIEKSLQRFYNKLKSSDLLDNLATIGSINKDTFRKAIYEPSKEAVVVTGGKRIRPVLVYLAHDIVGGSFKHIDDLAILPEFSHKGSVVIDDVEDEAQKRDGRDPLYKSHGVSIALNTGNFLYFVVKLVLDGVEIDEKRKLEILQDYFHGGLIAHIGQGSDIYWRETQTLPTEQEYLQMNAYKNSTFRFATKLGAISGNGTKEQKRSLEEIAEATGTAYQLRDDLLSLEENAHDYGDDITEGKISLMVLRTLQNQGKNAERLRSILSSKTRTPAVIREAINIMKNNGSIEYAEHTARNLVDKANEKLFKEFPESKYRKLFSQFIEYAVSRKK